MEPKTGLFTQKTKMKNRLSVCSALLLLTFNLYSQNTRLSLELSGGIPYGFTTISSSLSTFGGIGARYNITKELSIQGLVNIGSLTGKQIPAAVFSMPDNVLNYRAYNNNFIQYTLNGQLNLERVLGLRRVFKRVNPFLVVGGGFIKSEVVAYRNVDNNKKYNQSFYTGYGGLTVRYYMNPQMDFVFSSSYNLTQTYYLDGIYMDNKYDAFLLNSIGISYKFGAKSQKQHIEWNNVILKNRFYIPDIEKRNGQPIDEEGNYVVYSKDSISKLLAVNQQLQAQNSAQREEIEKQRKEIDSLKGDMGKVKVQMDTLANSIEELKKQNQDIINRLNAQPPVQPGNPSGPVRPNPVVTPPSGTDRPNSGTTTPSPAKTDTTATKATGGQKKKKKTTTVTVNVPTEEVDGESPKKDPVTSTEPKAEVSTDPSAGLNSIDGIVAPIERYNVVAGAYAGSKYAIIFRDKMRAKGYEAAIFRSDVNSKILRVCVLSTTDKKEAIRVMNKIRTEIDPKAWIHVYRQK